MRRTVIAFVTTLAVATTGWTAAALACGNSYRYELDTDTSDIIVAENQLEAGQYRDAIASIRGTFADVGDAVEQIAATPRAKPAKNAKSARRGADPRLRARANQVVAVAVVRLDGQVDLAAPEDVKKQVTPEARARQLEWAAAQLQVLATRAKGSPTVEARLAEALVATGELERALTLLSGLASKDLIPDAHAWLTLAQLHAGKGAVAARDEALRKCQIQAADPTMCKLTAAPGHG